MGNYYEVEVEITVNECLVVEANSAEEAKEEVENMSVLEITRQDFKCDEIRVSRVLSEGGETVFYINR